MKPGAAISWRRLWALCRKESYQIVRDPSSILVAFIMPVVLLFIMGYAVNLDAAAVRIGLQNNDSGQAAQIFVNALQRSSAFEVHSGMSLVDMKAQLAQGALRGIVLIQSDFSSRLLRGQGGSAIQVLVDGAEPNTANFIASYVQGVWAQSQAAMVQHGSAGPRVAGATRSAPSARRKWPRPASMLAAVSRRYGATRPAEGPATCLWMCKGYWD